MLEYLSVEQDKELYNTGKVITWVNFTQPKLTYTDKSILTKMEEQKNYDALKPTFIVIREFGPDNVMVKAWQDHWQTKPKTKKLKAGWTIEHSDVLSLSEKLNADVLKASALSIKEFEDLLILEELQNMIKAEGDLMNSLANPKADFPSMAIRSLPSEKFESKYNTDSESIKELTEIILDELLKDMDKVIKAHNYLKEGINNINFLSLPPERFELRYDPKYIMAPSTKPIINVKL